MDISVIIPLFNEEESLPELFAWIKRVMASNDFTYEVIFVNDGSAETMERAQHSSVVSKKHRAMLSSPWMPIYRILQTRFRDSTR